MVIFVENPELTKVLPLKTMVDQNIATYTSSTVRNLVFLVLISAFFGPFTLSLFPNTNHAFHELARNKLASKSTQRMKLICLRTSIVTIVPRLAQMCARGDCSP